MTIEDRLRLLKGGVEPHDGVWTDLGSGRGAFTRVLAELTGERSEIFSVDADQHVLDEQKSSIGALLPQAKIHYILADIREPIDLPPVDGVLMANTLHFFDDKRSLLHRVYSYLRPGGRLLLVEYDIDRGNMWVPYPISYAAWQTEASTIGFVNTRLLQRVASVYHGVVYSALSWKEG